MINNPLFLIVSIQQFPETHFSPRTSLSCKHFPLLLLVHNMNQLFKHTWSSAFYQTCWNINIFKAGSWLCATVTTAFLSCKGIQSDKSHLQAGILLFILCQAVNHTFRLGRSYPKHTKYMHAEVPLLTHAMPGFSKAGCSLNWSRGCTAKHLRYHWGGKAAQLKPNPREAVWAHPHLSTFSNYRVFCPIVHLTSFCFPAHFLFISQFLCRVRVYVDSGVTSTSLSCSDTFQQPPGASTHHPARRGSRTFLHGSAEGIWGRLAARGTGVKSQGFVN